MPVEGTAVKEVKETKAQRIERLKQAKNAWEALDEIRAFAKSGFDSIPAEWFATYFRTWGVYSQGDGAGVTGGKNGEGLATPFFMLRIRIPNGKLRSDQVRTIAEIAAKHARGVADITVRQNMQFHWLTIESLPEVLETLWSVGLSTTGACGDVARSITGCRDWCTYPEINDVGLTAVKRVRNGVSEIGFSLRVAGGLSTEPHLGIRLNAFIKADQVVPVVRGVAEIFRRSEVLRQSRDKARLKFLFLQHGWTAEQFLRELQTVIGFSLEPAEPEELPADVHRDHTGIHTQRQRGLSYIGASVLRGRITPQQLHVAADLAERYGDGNVRTTLMQNLLLANIPTLDAPLVAAALTKAGLPVEASVFARATVACTGSEYCKLALTETKTFARWLTTELEERIPDFDQQLKLHITGCPNSCGQHWIADIGIEGKKIKVDGKMVDAYYFCVGGGLGQSAAIARPVGYRCAATDVPDAIERLLNAFQRQRLHNENIRQFFTRHSADSLRGLLSGTPVIPMAVERDLSPGAVPHSVES